MSLVVNASGLGSRSLIGVEDAKCYPARGQTVLVRAPKAVRTIMRADTFRNNMLLKPDDPAPRKSPMSPLETFPDPKRKKPRLISYLDQEERVM